MTQAPVRSALILFVAMSPLVVADGAGQPFDIPSPNVPDDVRGINPALTLSFGSQKWADFNADGEMDFVMMGRLPQTELGVVPLFGDVFRSSPSQPEPTSPLIYDFFSSRTIRSMWLTDAAWGDYDNDGDLDLVVSGATDTGEDLAPATILYQVTGNQVAALEDVIFPGLHSGGVAWADYDDDGDLDLALCGVDAEGRRLATVFRNDGENTFVDASPGLAQVAYGEIDWIDYDLDGDTDLLLAGSEIDGRPRLVLYRNDGDGRLVDSGIPLTGVEHPAVHWGDYDADGDPDLLVAGYERSPLLGNGRTRLYRNDGGSLTEVPVNLPGVYYGDAQWLDYERDGDLDVVISGRREPFGSNITVACLQSGSSGVFSCTQLQVAGLGGQPVPGVGYGTLGWADYDHDSDLDLFITGDLGRDDPITVIYRNASGVRNFPPQPPDGLASSVSGDEVELTWLPAADPDAPSSSLRYAVRVGTSPGGIDISSPHADSVTGRRHLHDGGNAGYALRDRLTGLAPGTYFWSVQSIDLSLAGSPFAVEQSFTIGE